MAELKRFDIVGKYADEEVMYEFRPDGECYDDDTEWHKPTREYLGLED